jgi:hypothetical protein
MAGLEFAGGQVLRGKWGSIASQSLLSVRLRKESPGYFSGK